MFSTVRIAAAFVVFVCGHGVALAGAYEDVLLAAQNGRTDLVANSLSRGMDVNTAGPDGSSLLIIAAREDNQSLVEFLLAQRANVNFRNRYGDTALHAAATLGNVKVVKVLLAKGAEVNSPGWTPLHYASYGGHAAVAEALITHHAQLDLRAPNGQTALMLAAKGGHEDVIAVLVKGGADQSLVDADGKTYLAILEASKDKGVYQK